jgi:hypothetical protein
MLFVDSKFLFKIVDRLESGVWRSVTTLPKDVPLLSKDRMDTRLLHGSFTAVIKTIKD